MAGISSDIVLARATDPSPRAGQDGGLVSAILIWALEHDVIDAALVSALEGEGRRGRRSLPWPATGPRCWPPAGSRYTYSANTLAYPQAIGGRRAHRPGRDELPGLGPAGDEGPQGGQGGPAAWRCRSGCCARRPSTTPSSPSSSRPSTGWSAARSPRSTSRACSRSGPATAGTTRSPSKRATPGRARAARRAPTSPPSTPTSHRRHRRLQRLDPHHRPHRPGARHPGRHGRRRGDRDAPRRRRPRGVGAAAQAGPGEPAPLARRPQCRCRAASGTPV